KLIVSAGGTMRKATWKTALAVPVFGWIAAVSVTTQTTRPPTPAGGFRGRVVSAVVSTAAPAAGSPSGHPVAGATVHLVPTSAIDVTTPITASAVYAPPFPAEAVDEPLEDTIRLKGASFPRATTDA